ncbi:MG2 domain-containing protein [Gangjinia marincola]
MKKRCLLLFLALAVTTCKKSSDTETDNLFKFKEYIYQTTGGDISSHDPILISLAKPIEDWEEGMELSSKVLQVTPDVEGKLIAINANTLEFSPDKALTPDTEYTVRLRLDRIYSDVPSEFKVYSFKVKTITPNYSVNLENLQSYSKTYQYLNGSIKLSDVFPLDEVKKIISATQSDTNLKIKWTPIDLSTRSYTFVIDSIKRKEEDSSIEVMWDGAPISAELNGSEKMTIPGQNNFTIVDVTTAQSPDQYLSINFSDPLKKDQNFDGLVTIKGSKALKYVVNNNVLLVYPDKRITGNVAVTIFEGIKNSYGFKLKKSFSETISFEQLKPAVRVVRSGNILPNSNGLKYNLEAVNLKAVDVHIIKIYQDNVLQFLQENELNASYRNAIRRVGRRIAKKKVQLIVNELENTGKWKAYSIDLSTYFKSDPGAIYRVELSFSKADALYDCTVARNVVSDEDDDEYYYDDYYYDEYSDYGNYSQQNFANQEEREEAFWDNRINSYQTNNYNWKERENPCHESYYRDDHFLATNILATDLGLIAKRGENGSYYFAVTNMLTTDPVANAKVKLYNFQQQEIVSLSTDENGFTLYDGEEYAYFASAEDGKHTTYIKLTDGKSLSLSKYDVSGRKIERGLKGYIYGERGVWRPGDTLHLNFMLNDTDNPLPKNHPVKMEVTNARGKLIYSKVENTGVNRFYRFDVPTSANAPTGSWSAKVSVGGATYYKSLPVETIKPNRLKLKIDFDDEILRSTEKITGDLRVNWLHGAPAKNVRTEITAKLSAATNPFPAYKNFVFKDPTKKSMNKELTAFNQKVNNQGQADFSMDFGAMKNAPGMMQVNFLARAFETGGDFSMDVFQKKYAPFKSFVGLKSPKGRMYGSFYTNENHTFDVITLDDSGKPIQRKNLEVRMYEVKWRWWWSSSYDDLSSYTSDKVHRPYKSFKINTNSSGKGSFSINIPQRDNGRYLIRVVDPVSGHATGRTAYFYRNWSNRISTGDNEAAKMLMLSANKEKYVVGEEAKITFPSGSEGRALISVENGVEVVQTKWVKTTKGETTASITITKEMAPNVYINVSLLQPHGAIQNDLPIRLFGIIPINVYNPSTILKPELSLPNEIKPESTFTLKVSEENDQAMTYTLAVVDEGLLDLTRFKTPNAWDEFYAKQALGVKTWDIYDDVIGAYGGNLDQVFAIGGDAEANGAAVKKANRFPPVVKVLGPFKLKKGQTAKHTINMPKYIGSVRTMVVAGSIEQNAYGSAEKVTPVRKPLMVLASLPRRLALGEKVALPVTVFAMKDKVKRATVKLKLPKEMKAVGEMSKTVTFKEPGEQMVYFELEVSDKKGISTIEIEANGNGEKASYQVELELMNPNPVTSRVTEVELQPNAELPVTFETFGLVGTNRAELELSTLPPMNISKRLQYLTSYPHGCVEQTTSAVFPQLYLPTIMEFSYEDQQQMKKNIEKAIKRLGNFQQPNGGLSYWMGSRSANDWGTSYAGHFMIEAEKKGYSMPLTFMSQWKQYQLETARNWRPGKREYRSDLAQAYRLYTLALAGSPELAAMNRLREYASLSNDAKWRLAAAYALAGQKEAARQLANRSNIEFESRRDYYTYGSVDRNRAMAMETMLLLDDKTSIDLAKSIAKALSSKKWMSTQTTAYCLMTMAKMVEKNGGRSVKVNYTINGSTEKASSTFAISQSELDVKAGVNELTFSNQLDNLVFARIITYGVLPLGKEQTTQRNLNASVGYKTANGASLDISSLLQGTDVVATVTITNPTSNPIYDIALTEIFPSGWEIVNTKFTGYGNAQNNQANYTDIKDDRVNFYFDLPKRKSKSFTVLLNAAYLGKYYLPGIQAEAMYDNDHLVRNKGTWVEVVKE